MFGDGVRNANSKTGSVVSSDIRKSEVHLGAQNLWRWDGRLGRTQFCLIGVTALFLKFALDWLIVSQVYHRPWSLLFYWRPFGNIHDFHFLKTGDVFFGATLLVLALPFVWLGLATIVKRLRDAGQPVWLACLFFIPIVNWAFFAALCLLPTASHLPEEEASPWPGPGKLDRWIPKTPMGNAVVTVAMTTLLGLTVTFLGTQAMTSYGWGLFVAQPFCMGLFAVLLYSYHEPRTLPTCLAISLLPLGVLGIVLLVVALEGVICLLMAAPIATVLALLGGSLGYAIQITHWTRRGAPFVISVVLVAMPSLLGYEHNAKPQPHVYQVQSEIVVNAPPEIVWQKVVSFTQIAPPKELLFRAGVAYPIRAEIAGSGVGAVRRCVFSTGAFVEPIETWDEPKLLRFSVAENPAPLNELTPYGHIEPAHLHGYFVSHHGQFQLADLPGGRTKLIGTTWYTNAMWPEQYWHHWSDYIIHRIHMRVLLHIQEEAEQRPPQTN